MVIITTWIITVSTHTKYVIFFCKTGGTTYRQASMSLRDSSHSLSPSSSEYIHRIKITESMNLNQLRRGCRAKTSGMTITSWSFVRTRGSATLKLETDIFGWRYYEFSNVQHKEGERPWCIFRKPGERLPSLAYRLRRQFVSEFVWFQPWWGAGLRSRKSQLHLV